MSKGGRYVEESRATEHGGKGARENEEGRTGGSCRAFWTRALPAKNAGESEKSKSKSKSKSNIQFQ
jgi:hypothetical protein